MTTQIHENNGHTPCKVDDLCCFVKWPEGTEIDMMLNHFVYQLTVCAMFELGGEAYMAVCKSLI